MAEPSCFELEERLHRMARHLDMPPTPELADRVLAGIDQGRAPSQRRPFWARPAFAAGFAVFVLVGAGLTFSPAARDAVAGWIGLDGWSIEYAEEPASPLGNDLLLGEPTTLGEAVSTAGFAIRPPAALGTPQVVYIATEPETRISLVYAARDDLPRTSTTRVGVLLSAFRAQIDRQIVLKKAVGTGSAVEQIDVNGAPGYWISGKPHALYYIDENGQFTEDRGRLAGNTLAWQKGDIVYRLESALPKSGALAIARSVP